MKRRSSRRSADRLEALVLAVIAHDVKSLDSHRVRGVSAVVVTNNNHQVSQHQNAALEVVALSFAVHVAEQEDAQDDGNHVPLREEKRERVVCGFSSRGNTRPERRVKDQGGDLKEAHLQGVG